MLYKVSFDMESTLFYANEAYRKKFPTPLLQKPSTLFYGEIICFLCAMVQIYKIRKIAIFVLFKK